jgi:hypothetical protein
MTGLCTYDLELNRSKGQSIGRHGAPPRNGVRTHFQLICHSLNGVVWEPLLATCIVRACKHCMMSRRKQLLMSLIGLPKGLVYAQYLALLCTHFESSIPHRYGYQPEAESS